MSWGKRRKQSRIELRSEMVKRNKERRAPAQNKRIKIKELN